MNCEINAVFVGSHSLNYRSKSNKSNTWRMTQSGKQSFFLRAGSIQGKLWQKMFVYSWKTSRAFTRLDFIYLYSGVRIGETEEDWRDKPGRRRQRGSSAGIWAQADRQRIGPESSSVFQMFFFFFKFYLHLFETTHPEKTAADCRLAGETLWCSANWLSLKRAQNRSGSQIFCRCQRERHRSLSRSSSTLPHKHMTASTNGGGGDMQAWGRSATPHPHHPIHRNSCSHLFLHLPRWNLS